MSGPAPGTPQYHDDDFPHADLVPAGAAFEAQLRATAAAAEDRAEAAGRAAARSVATAMLDAAAELSDAWLDTAAADTWGLRERNLQQPERMQRLMAETMSTVTESHTMERQRLSSELEHVRRHERAVLDAAERVAQHVAREADDRRRITADWAMASSDLWAWWASSAHARMASLVGEVQGAELQVASLVQRLSAGAQLVTTADDGGDAWAHAAPQVLATPGTGSRVHRDVAVAPSGGAPPASGLGDPQTGMAAARADSSEVDTTSPLQRTASGRARNWSGHSTNSQYTPAL